jgi:methyl-accepting chemotaxis protein
MNPEHAQSRSNSATESFVRGMRSRLAFLILASTLAVAIVFGVTFYFALLSNESAVARQIPELGQVAAKLKSLLIMNTLVFVAIIITSFYLLARIITARIFRPLGEIQSALLSIAGGKLPRSTECGSSSAFGDLAAALAAAVSRITERDRAETSALTNLADTLSRNTPTAAAAGEIRELLKRRLTLNQEAATTRTAQEAQEKDPLFIQPL